MRLAEKVTLLLFNEAAGTFTRAPQLSRNFALGGSVFSELVIESRIDSDAEQVIVIDAAPLENELLDPMLSRIVQSVQTRDVAHWIRDAAAYAGDTLDCSLKHLVEHGILALQERRTMGIRRASRYGIVDRAAAGKPKKEILNVLSGTDVPDLRDAVLVLLADGCGILDKFLPNRELRSRSERLYRIGRTDMLGGTISRALATIEAELVRRLY